MMFCLRQVRLTAFIVFLFSLLVVVCWLDTRSASAASGPSVPSISGVKASYASPILESAPRADGKIHINTPATIARLQQLHVTTYAFLIWTQGHYWDDLRLEFMPAAQTAGIKVWVYLTPPTEGVPQPFGGNYTEWAKQIATLANTYSNLEAWVIDDFTANLGTFPPASMTSLQNSAHAINPQLAVFVIAYYEQATSTFANDYKNCIDGIIYPHAERTALNTDAYIDTLYSRFHPYNLPIYYMPYGTFANYTTMKSAETIQTEMQKALAKQALGKLQGIVVYATPLVTTDELGLNPGDPYPYATNGDWYYEFTNDELTIPWGTHNTAKGANSTVKQTAAVTAPADSSVSFDAYSYAPNGYNFGSDGNIARISYPGNTPGAAGIWAELSQTVTVTDGASTSVTFKVKDDYTGGTSGYIFKQLLVDGIVAWQEDVAGQNGNWETVTVNLSPYMTGKTTANIQLRLKNVQAVTWFNVVSSWDDVAAKGFKVVNPYFDGDYGWTKTQSTASTANTFSINWPWGKPSYAGTAGSKVKTATISPAAQYNLTMKVRDDFISAVPGYHFMQLLVDGVVVWERDVSDGSADWQNVNLNLTSQLTGKSTATFNFRVYDKAGVNNFGVNTEWAITSTTGFTLDEGSFTSLLSTSDIWVYSKGSAYSISYPSGVASSNGSQGGVNMVAAVTPGLGSKTLDFQVRDDYTSTTPAGYHFAQVVVDGVVVWERDVAGGTTAWQSVHLDLTSALAEKLTANIVFRVYDKQGVTWFPVKVDYTNIVANGFTLTNPTFQSTGGWIYADNNAAYLGPYTTEIVTQGPGMALLQMLIDGQVVWSQDASRLSASPWARYKVDTSPYTAGKSSVEVQFRMIFTQPVSGLAEIIRIDNLAVTGMTMQNLSFENTTGWTSTFTDQNVATGYGGPKRGIRVFNNVQAMFQ
ncbi:hypothetical protein [Cohnella soli]|uniref:Uncharacterized protein n=1 Tax=Cohnella soli TaxID=425005 RepID=A0ABW0HVL8_9BACL